MELELKQREEVEVQAGETAENGTSEFMAKELLDAQLFCVGGGNADVVW
jgi:hypothetical protein